MSRPDSPTRLVIESDRSLAWQFTRFGAGVKGEKRGVIGLSVQCPSTAIPDGPTGDTLKARLPITHWRTSRGQFTRSGDKWQRAYAQISVILPTSAEFISPLGLMAKTWRKKWSSWRKKQPRDGLVITK